MTSPRRITFSVPYSTPSVVLLSEFYSKCTYMIYARCANEFSVFAFLKRSQSLSSLSAELKAPISVYRGKTTDAIASIVDLGVHYTFGVYTPPASHYSTSNPARPKMTGGLIDRLKCWVLPFEMPPTESECALSFPMEFLRFPDMQRMCLILWLNRPPNLDCLIDSDSE